jgi:cellulase
MYSLVTFDCMCQPAIQLLTFTQGNVNPAAASGKCSFGAGDTVTIEMHQHNSRQCTEEGIGGAHWGPVLAYMGKVEDAAKADGSGEFFKVYQNGWAKAPGSSQGDADFWGTKDMNYNCTFTPTLDDLALIT